MAEEVPVYLITGFMDSGKTTLIHETLFDQEFGRGSRTVLILCEDGDVEYDREELKEIPAELVEVTDKEAFRNGKLQEIEDQYHPDQVLIEYNGTWEIACLLEADFPPGWEIVQSIATVDGSTYEMYYNNMRQMIKEQIFKADVVIFNRCDDNTPRAKFRRTVKAINRAAQIVYEKKDGSLFEGEDEELPYDLAQDLIDLPDADYGIWYLDAMEHPKNYDRKKVHFLAYIYNPPSNRGMCDALRQSEREHAAAKEKAAGIENVLNGHRLLMGSREQAVRDLTAEVRVEWAREYKGKGPVLYPVEIHPAEAPEEEMVYFT